MKKTVIPIVSETRFFAFNRVHNIDYQMTRRPRMNGFEGAAPRGVEYPAEHKRLILAEGLVKRGFSDHRVIGDDRDVKVSGCSSNEAVVQFWDIFYL